MHKKFLGTFMVVMMLMLIGVHLTSAQDQAITLTYWETLGPSDGGVQAQVIADYQAAHPNVTINEVYVPFEEMSVKLPPALASGNGPDVIYADVAPQFLGSYVQANKILPLDEAYDKYKWNGRVFDWAKRRATYGDHVYALGHEVEVLTLMYNKKIFDQLGLKVPGTLEDLETTMQSIKDKSPDITPMMLATGPNPWNGFHMMHALAYATMDVSKIANTTPQGTGTYDDPDWIHVFQIYRDWVTKGFFPEDANSIDWDGHWSLFCAGKVAMLAQGTWLFKTISDCEAENPDVFSFGVAPFPSAAGRPYQSYVGIGSAWYLNADLANDAAKKDAAFQFLDAMITPKTAASWVQQAQLFPAVPFDQSAVTLTDQQKEALAIIDKAGPKGGGPIPVGFNNSPGEQQVWENVVQGLVAGSITPQQAADALNVELVKAQKAWAAGLPTGS